VRHLRVEVKECLRRKGRLPDAVVEGHAFPRSGAVVQLEILAGNGEGRSAMQRIGVMPMPPARSRLRCARRASVKWFFGKLIFSVSPSSALVQPKPNALHRHPWTSL
jgi:hypothetical protein